MMKLRPYKDSDARVILSWIEDERTHYRWCAGLFGAYPIKEEDMIRYYDALKEDETYWGMTAFDEKGVAGHFSLRFVDNTQEAVRIGFVIVDKSQRGQGMGRELMRLGVQYAKEFLGVKKVTLGVFVDNVSARKCYEGLGFCLAREEVTKYQIQGQEWDCLEMELEV